MSVKFLISMAAHPSLNLNPFDHLLLPPCKYSVQPKLFLKNTSPIVYLSTKSQLAFELMHLINMLDVCPSTQQHLKTALVTLLTRQHCGRQAILRRR